MQFAPQSGYFTPLLENEAQRGGDPGARASAECAQDDRHQGRLPLIAEVIVKGHDLTVLDGETQR